MHVSSCGGLVAHLHCWPVSLCKSYCPRAHRTYSSFMFCIELLSLGFRIVRFQTFPATTASRSLYTTKWSVSHEITHGTSKLSPSKLLQHGGQEKNVSERRTAVSWVECCPEIGFGNLKALVTLERPVLVEEGYMSEELRRRWIIQKAFQSTFIRGARLKSNPFLHCIQNARHC